MEENSKFPNDETPYLVWKRADGERIPTNVGEILRDAEHERLLAICGNGTQTENNLALRSLSDYEYFRLYTECFGDFSDTETGKTDLAFLRFLLGSPVLPRKTECETLWSACNRSIDENRDITNLNATKTTSVYCYPMDLSTWMQVNLSELRELLIPSVSLILLTEPMPAVFRRPDPYHAELAYRKLLSGTATAEEKQLLYAQALRVAAIVSADMGIPIVLSSVSPELPAFLQYLYEEAGVVRVLACVNEVSFFYLPDRCNTVCLPAISDVQTAVRIAPYYPLSKLIFFPKMLGAGKTVSSHFCPAYAFAAQKRFEETLAYSIKPCFTESKTHSEEAFLRAVCRENLLRFLKV